MMDNLNPRATAASVAAVATAMMIMVPSAQPLTPGQAPASAVQPGSPGIDFFIIHRQQPSPFWPAIDVKLSRRASKEQLSLLIPG